MAAADEVDELVGRVVQADADLADLAREERLTELIHEDKAEEAAAINNGGAHAQVSYLVDKYGRDTAGALVENAVADACP